MNTTSKKTTALPPVGDAFRQQNDPPPELSQLSRLVREALVSPPSPTLQSNKDVVATFAEASPAKTEPPEPPPHTAQDDIEIAVSGVIQAYYSIQDPDPAAEIGDIIVPLTVFRTERDESCSLTLHPYPLSALNGYSVDPEMFDADIHDAFRRLFNDLTDVNKRGVKLKEDIENCHFVIRTKSPLEMLLLFEDLMTMKNYPTRDMVYYDSTLERDVSIPGTSISCFNSEAEHEAYLRERALQDQEDNAEFLQSAPDKILDYIPGRPFSDGRDAARISADYIRLADRMRFLDISFKEIAERYRAEKGIPTEQTQSVNPLLKMH